jgi:hypothetical protein
MNKHTRMDLKPVFIIPSAGRTSCSLHILLSHRVFALCICQISVRHVTFTLLPCRRAHAAPVLTRQRRLGLPYWHHSLTVAEGVHFPLCYIQWYYATNFPHANLPEIKHRDERSEFCVYSPPTTLWDIQTNSNNKSKLICTSSKI